MIDTAPTPEVSAARDEIADLTTNSEFVERYATGDVDAQQRMGTLHRAAYPEPAGSDTAAPTSPAEQAQAKINELRADPDFIKRVEQCDPLAQAELAQLHREATPAPLPFTFPEGAPIAEVVEANTVAEKIIENLELDRELAHGAVAVFEKAHAARLGADGRPRPMDQIELARMEASLQERLGSDYDERMDRFEAMLRKAGKDGGPWLQQAILASGPTTAAWAVLSLTQPRAG